MYDSRKKNRAESSNHKTQGLSLIELIIVMAIFAVITGGISLNYTKYTKRQTLKQEGLTLKQELRLIQSKAKTGDKTGCAADVLFGWKVLTSPESGTTPASVSHQAACVDASDTVYVSGTVNSNTFKPGITFASGNEFFFQPLTLPVSDSGGNPVTVLLMLTNGTNTCSVSVSSAGEISDEGCDF